ncbi:glycosyltransferase family 4 protein [Nocardia wallacei]|uniref:glycosyltransferase family 4 protein n=1 Tax=Nocardia wallacei TaxID=480035 RepID=UPI002455FB2F|nr:glycosyltransferase family 4 protein [Nocardia wallacei]
MSRPTIVVALHDGFYGCGTGAGYANKIFLEILVDLLPPEARLTVLPVQLSPASPEFDQDWHTDTQRLLARADAEVVPLHNGTHGATRFGGLPQFRRLATETADALHRVVPTSTTESMVIAFDVPFFGVAPLLPPALVSRMVVVPRSTAAIHTPDDPERRAWESYGLHAVSSGGGRIAAISHYMRHHLTGQYWLPGDTVIDLQDGLGPRDWQIGRTDDNLLPGPARGGFLLTMGRAHPYKGFDDLLDALVLLRRSRDDVPHLVMAAVGDAPEPNRYQRHLTDRIADERLNVTLLTTFAPTIRSWLAHPDLLGVVVPSRAEPFGRIPIEAYATHAGPVIATTAGGLAEQVVDGRTGFTTPPGRPDGLADAIRTALTLDTTGRDQILRQATQFARTHFDHPRAVGRFLRDNAPWLPLLDRQSL